MIETPRLVKRRGADGTVEYLRVENPTELAAAEGTGWQVRLEPDAAQVLDAPPTPAEPYTIGEPVAFVGGHFISLPSEPLAEPPTEAVATSAESEQPAEPTAAEPARRGPGRPRKVQP